VAELTDGTSAKDSGDGAENVCNTSSSALQRLGVRVRRHGIRRTLSYLLFVVIGEKCGLQILRRFEFDRNSTGPTADMSDGFKVAILAQVDDLTSEDTAFLKKYGEWAAFLDRLNHGRKCLVLRSVEGQLACACWFGPLDESSDSPGIIDHCFTRYEFRGRGLYAWAITHIATSDDANIGMRSRPVLIECSPFNHSSRQGIIKAGFVPKHESVQFLGRTVLSWSIN
tara:strand:- start:6715 stop:7392 length:678 start_codon:yes stop_codon:yes gene_type:complete